MKLLKDNIISAGKGTPVVLLHSAMSSKLQWYQLMRSLSNDHLVIAVDFSGYGDSPFPIKTENFSLSDEIAFVEPLLNEIIPADEPFHLVGHSYGGAVGLRFCYKDEKRILSLALFEPVAFHLLDKTDEVLAKVRHHHRIVSNYVEQKNYDAAAKYFVDLWNGPGTFDGYPKEIKEMLSQSVKKLPLGFRALVEEPLCLEDYSKLEVPVCLLAGRQSPIDSRRIAELLARNLPNCQFHWVNGAHMTPLFQPELVNPIIGDFIRHTEKG